MRYVVLGASAAGINAAAAIRNIDQDGEIILVSEDKNIYSRCILHHYMCGERTLEGLNFVDENFMEQHRILWKKGVKAVGVSSTEKCVTLSDGEKLSFDRLLIATGSHSFIPPIPGISGAANAIGFHNLSDCELIMEQARKAEHIVIMGAGLVGLDVASGLIDYGKVLTLVDMKEHLLPMQLDNQSAESYQTAFREHGVNQLYNVGIQEAVCDENDRIVQVILTDGTKLPCDLLVITIGVRANVGFLEESGIETDRYGLVIDECGRTNVEGIFGAGDVTGHNPIWPAAVKEGMIAASNMAGKKRLMTDFFASKSTMNFQGIPTMSLGIHDAPDETYRVEVMEDDQGNYKKVIHKEGTIYGAILQGDLSYAGVLTQLIRRKIDVSKVKKPLFRIDYSDFFHMQDNYEFDYEGEEG